MHSQSGDWERENEKQQLRKTTLKISQNISEAPTKSLYKLLVNYT
jgi:hypothetical protein